MQRETTFLGAAVDDLVYRARSAMRLGADDAYDLVAENFDHRHYILSHPGVWERPGLDLVRHFLNSSPRVGRSPHPDFSMHAYLELNPARARGPGANPYVSWLTEGREAGEIADPAPRIQAMADMLGLSSQETVSLLVERRTTLIDSLVRGELGAMYQKATEIEPLIGRTSVRFTRPRLLPFGHPPAVDQAAAIHAAHRAAGFRRARVVLVVNRVRWGGGRRMEGHLAHALARTIEPEDVVVVYADEAGGSTPPGRFPDGVRELDVADLIRGLEPEEQQAALVLLLRTFRADAIVNLNSATLYTAMQTLGKALAASERMFLCLFCNEQMPIGAWTGWSLRYFYRLYEQVTGVFTDSDFLARQLTETYRVPPAGSDRLQVLRAPVDPSLPLVSEPPTSVGRRPQVFWAGRWVRQKRIDLVLEIAASMPDVDVRMWGEPAGGARGPSVPGNVVLEGRYDHISAIPLAEADAWLYTSGWDGVPSQLLEVAMTGIPLVGTLVGGTGEVLSPEGAWPVGEAEGADAYERAIREILGDPAGARRRAVGLRERLLRERTEAGFAEHVARELLTDRADEVAQR